MTQHISGKTLDGKPSKSELHLRVATSVKYIDSMVKFHGGCQLVCNIHANVTREGRIPNSLVTILVCSND